MVDSPASTYIYGGPATALLPPDPVATLTQTDQTVSSITIAWTVATVPAGGTAVRGYNIYQDGALVQTVGPLVTTVTIQGLTTGPNFTVAAYNGDGEGDKSPVLVGVLGSAQAPGAPPNFRFTVVGTASTATVAWDAASAPIDDPVQGYRIRKIGSTVVIAETTTALTANLTGLATGDQIQVKAYNSTSQGKGSTTLTFTPGSSSNNVYTPIPSGLISDSYSIACLLQNQSSLYGDAVATKAALLDLGVKHVRCRYAPNGAAAIPDFLRDIAETEGITFIARFGAIEDGPTQPTPTQIVASLLDDFGPTTALPNRKVSTYVHSIEGWNEPNNNGTPWIDRTVDFTKKTWDAVRAQAALDTIKVMGPAFARINGATGAEGGADGISDGTLAGQCKNFGAAAEAIHGQTGKGLGPWVDWGVMHIYPLGAKPSTDYETFSVPLRSFVYKAPTPLPTTEGGYSTDMLNTTLGNPTPSHVSGIYDDKHLMEHVIRGTPIFNRHELWDDAIPAKPTDKQRRENSFGLKNRDKTNKLGFNTMKRFLALVKDDDVNKKPKRNLATTPITIAVSPSPGAAGSTNTLRFVVAQRSDGAYLLIAWFDENVNWAHVAPDYPITPRTPTNVTFTLQAAKTWNVYMPSKQAGVVSSSSTPVTNFTLSLGDNLAVCVLT